MSSVRLLALRETALSVDEVLAAVTHPGAGGVVVFIGSVRDRDGDRAVQQLGYTAHPNAETELRSVADSVARRYPTVWLAAAHRLGDLAVGEAAVIVAAAGPHRAEAFDAARALIDELKATVPIWKHQLFVDGADEWVGTP